MERNSTLDTLYEIQEELLKEMPQKGEDCRNALDKLDALIDELESEI